MNPFTATTSTILLQTIDHDQAPWWRRPVVLLSLILHGLLLLALWQLSRHAPPLAPAAKTIELVLQQLQAPPAAEPPHPAVVSKPVAMAAARPAPLRPVLPPQHTVAAAPEQAELAAPAKPELTPAPVPAPATDPVVAKPAAPTAARTIAMEGIPSDYVNQVYSRINRQVSYPRGARLRGEQGRVGYRLTLSTQGELLKLDLQSSGSDELDRAAAKAIKAAAPFGKLPDLGGGSYLLAGSILFSLNAL